ncbi:MAG: hypothetical protein RML72_00625 [Bacteroidia bacterium]|nr:hypothetical protein [Bacteroidia bacterium]MDW8157370.1 hypothetical protein [Bacteroidia bacterium]
MLNKLNESLEDLNEKEIVARLEGYKAQFKGLEPAQVANPTNLIDLFDYIRILIFTNAFKESLEQLNFARQTLDLALAQDPDNILLLELLIEWNRVAMRFIPPQSEEYVEYPFFMEIINTTDGREGDLQIHHWQAHIGLVNNYLHWKGANGNPDLLAAEDRIALEQYLETLEERVQNQLKTWKEKKEFVPYILVKRSFANYYLQNHQVQKGLSLMIELLEELPLFPSYTHPDKADLQMEIASIYWRYRRIGEAMAYVKAARLIYENSGPQYIRYVEEADIWLEQLFASPY